MVLILGRRLTREESVIRDSPAIKRKVSLLMVIFSVPQLFTYLMKITQTEKSVFNPLRCLRLTPKP